MEGKDLESPENREEEEARPPRPVPDISVDGDMDTFEEEPIPEDDFGENPEGSEPPEEPNDLSGIDKEFED